MSMLPSTLNQNLQKKRSMMLADAKTIDEIAAIYSQHIQSDNLPISINALKDRINVFLEGWDDFLHQQYAVALATLKAGQASEVADAWQEDKINNNKISKRITVI